MLDAELAAREFSIRGDNGTSLGDVDQVGGVERRVAEIPTARRTGEIEHLAVDRLHFQLQMALELIEVERASDAQRAERFVGLEETDRKVFHLGGRDVAVEFAAFAGKACERSVSLHNLVCDFSSDELRHEVRAEGELQRSGTPGLKQVMRVGLGALHLHGRGQGQFARTAVLQLVETDVDIGQLDGLTPAVLEDLHRAQADIFERHVFHVELRRFRRFGRRFRGGLFLFAQQRVEVAGSVGILNDLNRGRIERDFIHFDVAADDAPETVTEPHFVRLKERLGAGGFDFELAQYDLGKRTDGGVADRDLGVQRFADARQDDAFEERRAGGDEISDDQQEQKSGAELGQSASPGPACHRPGGFRCCVGHNSSDPNCIHSVQTAKKARERQDDIVSGVTSCH